MTEEMVLGHTGASKARKRCQQRYLEILGGWPLLPKPLLVQEFEDQRVLEMFRREGDHSDLGRSQ